MSEQAPTATDTSLDSPRGTPESPDLGERPDWGIEADATEEAVAKRLFGRAETPRLGRFEVGDRLGRGGMGEVWAAYDPQLQRDVALKTVRVSRWARREERSTLLDEARALARLRHDNVLSVHDVLEIDSVVVVVMERVDGEVLRTWARRGDVTRREVLAALESAARGLAAVHAAGLAHLDFKPDNVLVGRDGRVLVADFGLAAPLNRARTRVGGTPGYAAPEQLDRDNANLDARADQFAFASTVCSVLAGSPAVPSDTPIREETEALRAHVRRQVRRTGLRRLQRAALSRALAWDPGERFESMTALSEALFARPRTRQRQLLALGGLAVAVGAGIAGARMSDPPPACAGVTAQAWMRDAWDPTQRDAFTSAAAEHPATEPGALRAADRLDERRRALISGWPSICDADARTGGSARAGTRRCFERRREELAAVSTLLADPSPKTLERAPDIVGALELMEDCERFAGIEFPIPERTADELERTQKAYALLAAARVHAQAGSRDEQRAALDEARAIVDTLDDKELQAKLDQRRGYVAIDDGDLESGLEQVEAAYLGALEAGADLLAADTATLLVYLAGAAARQPERGERWATHARALLAKIDAGPKRRGRLSAYLGALAGQTGRADDSLAHYREAVEWLGDTSSEDPVLMMAALNGVAIGLETTGDARAALAMYERLEPLARAEFGPRHPRYSRTINNIGSAQQAVGDYDAAIESHEYAIEIAVEHGMVRAEHSARLNLCFAHASARNGARGLADCNAAIETCLKMFDGNANRCSNDYMALGNTLAHLGRGEEALAAYQTVFEAYEADYEPDDPLMAWAHSSLGAGHVAAGNWEQAKEQYTRARELGAHAAWPAAELAEIDFGLARALHALGEPQRAIELARGAARAYEENGQRIAAAEIQDWLDDVESR